MLKSIKLEWKPFKAHLPELELWMRESFSSYAGNSADDNGLTLWFTEEPDQDIKDLVEIHWDSLEEESELAKSKLMQDKELAVEEAKANIVHQTWNQLIIAERKLILNQTLTDTDKDALLIKYPQA